MRQYVTTAIDFPNAAPHMGHVYEKILADVLVRWMRLRGDDVRFHLGTDENGIKIQQTAKNLGITPRELVDRNAPAFEELFRRLDISFDYFIRTADPVSHWPTVTALWHKLQEAGYLEKRTYKGLYCTGCERFVTAKDLVDGTCPDHGVPPVEVQEDNWFFLLHKKQDDLRALLDPKKGSYRIVPDWRGNETFSFLDQGLEDVSFSRSKQTLSWGVPVPGDPDQVMYVWCDNLTSYISSLGAFTDHAMMEWWDDAEVTHVIGKDIARFHALNWPAMLQCAGVRTPDRLLVHGFITSEGQKMSKSLGNVVAPDEVLAKYSVDVLRFFLMHEVPVGNDGDFSWKRLQEMYDAKLRNQLGNMLNRVLVLWKKAGTDLTSPVPSGMGLEAAVSETWKTYVDALDRCEMQAALLAVFQLVDRSNVLMQQHQPWTKTGAEKDALLTEFAEGLRHVALMLLPFIPGTAQRIAAQLGLPDADRMLDKGFVLTDAMRRWGGQKGWERVGEPKILFAPLDK